MNCNRSIYCAHFKRVHAVLAAIVGSTARGAMPLPRLLVVGCWLLWLWLWLWLLLLWWWLWLLLLCQTLAEARQCVYPQSPVLIGNGSPRWRRTPHHRGLQNLALNSGTTRRSAKKGVNTAENPPPTAIWLQVKIMFRFSSANCAGKPGQPTR